MDQNLLSVDWRTAVQEQADETGRQATQAALQAAGHEDSNYHLDQEWAAEVGRQAIREEILDAIEGRDADNLAAAHH